MTPTRSLRLACAGLIGLTVLLWPWWLSYPRGVEIAGIMSLIALLPLPGVLRGHRYTHAWSSMLATGYMAIALVEAYSTPDVRLAATGALLAAGLWFVGSITYVRSSGRANHLAQ